MNIQERLYRTNEKKEQFYREREEARAVLRQLIDYANATDPQDRRLNDIIILARSIVATPMPSDAQIAAAMGPCGK